MRRVPGRAIGGPWSNGKPDACASRCRNVDPGGPAGSSRSTSPSSAATSMATAVASLVTDAHANRRPTSPCTASTRPATPTATCSHGHPSTWRSASTNGDTSGHGAGADLLGRGLRAPRRVLARRAGRRPRLGLRHGADHAGRRRSAAHRVRAGARLPRDHRARARRGRCVARRRRPDAHLRHRRVADRRGRPGARRGLPERAAGDDGDRRAAARPALAGGDRGRSGDTHLVKQIYPSSITGKGSLGTGATGASVLEHAFGKGDPYTLGVEEEYMLLDPETWDLVQHIDSVLAAVEDGEHQERINAELMQSVLEVTTPVCHNAGDVLRALQKLRGYIAETARSQGCRYGSAGTHPFSLFERQRITA